MHYLKDLSPKDLKNKEAIVRVDFNVTLKSDGGIEDDTRIKASLKTIKFLLQSGVKEVYLISHLGRPVVRQKELIEKIALGNQNLTLAKVAEKLASWLKIKSPIEKISLRRIGFPAYKLSENLFLLENIRFDSREEKNDKSFAKLLSTLVSFSKSEQGIFINDAFAVCHRAHASVVGITNYLPSYAGFLIQKEMESLDKLISEPEKPFVLILGGAKVYDKMMVLKNLLKKVDFVLLGGVMANTFMKARNIGVRNSIVENDRLELANKLFSKSAKKFILPTTLVWDKGRIVDVDAKAIGQWQRYFDKAKTIFWNGTMGLTSLGNYKFARGSEEIAKMMANSKAKTIVSGGDTIAEVNKLKLLGKMSFVSTGGGATLEYLAGNKLPGLEALK